MNGVMKHINGVMLASLLAFNASAEKPADPELWKCDSVNLPEAKRIYLVYRQLDFMLFSGDGGLLDLGTLRVSQTEEVTFLTATLKLKSGMRNMFISNTNEKNTMLMQIFSANDGKTADLFTCK